MKTVLISALFSAFLATAIAAPQDHSTLASNIQIKTPKVELEAHNTTTGGVFMQLDNTSNKAVDLVAAVSPIATEVQLHKTVMEPNGQSIMKKVSNIEVLPKQEADLNPRGFHVMLIGIKSPLQVDQSVPVTLIFSDGSHLTVDAKVG